MMKKLPLVVDTAQLEDNDMNPAALSIRTAFLVVGKLHPEVPFYSM